MRGFGRWLRSNTTVDEGYRPCFSKAAYRTEKLANEVLDRRQQSSSAKLRIYKCDICFNWHLTKKEKVGS